MIDAVALAVDNRLLEAERVDEELDESARVARAERGPHLRWRCLCHASDYPQ
jgi:preprotein translocase subunit SecD